MAYDKRNIHSDQSIQSNFYICKINMQFIYILVIYGFLGLEVNSQICQKVRKVPVTVMKTRTVPYMKRERNWMGKIKYVPAERIERYTDVIRIFY